MAVTMDTITVIMVATADTLMADTTEDIEVDIMAATMAATADTE